MNAAIRHAGYLLICAALAACGGGGGSSPATDAIVPSASLAGLCAAPRQGSNDRSGTLADEKRWVRAWIDETYLWYDEVPADLMASTYATPVDYFDVLKTPAKTPSGRPKDRYHFTLDTAQYLAMQDSGVLIGYGMEIAVIRAAPPRELRVATVGPGTPAAVAGVARGDQLLMADGVEVSGGSADAINAALAPSRTGEQHRFSFGRKDGSVAQVTLTSAAVTTIPVPTVKTIASANGLVGYLLFDEHSEPAEAQLISAIGRLKAAGVNELVLDLRYNGGGVLAIASQLAFMVAGPATTQGKTFERLISNRKNPFKFTASQASMPFYGSTLGFSVPAGQSLPQLGLSRVTVLTGPDTCSASESIINSLRGVGVQVDLVGGTTCGKPYAFIPQDNCGTTYFAIQFQGVNELGQGDYGDGFAPGCAVADDFDHALGDPVEARLAAALAMRAGGACPAAPAAGSQKPTAAGAEAPYLRRMPLREIKRIDRPLP
ncbi:MAG TPA: S41 family peptidase [Variovorax sp.]|nr:S41 family peptidase [Variovorax sp.]